MARNRRTAVPLSKTIEIAHMTDFEYFSIASPLPEYPNYRISTHGRVLSLTGREPRILKPSTNSSGYLQVDLCSGGKRKHMLIHRLVAMAFLNNQEDLPLVDHLNENKTDNRLENLRWASSATNNRNMSKIVKGSISYKHDGRNLKFQACYPVGSKKRATKCFDTRAEAEAWLAPKRRRHCDPYHDA